jgi:predicted small lipoprotein YifL
MRRAGRAAAALATLLTLGACGFDGPPVPPAEDEDRPRPGVTISGTARIGVTSG